MTTNSPNPVDADVQALIADCERDIDVLEAAIDYQEIYSSPSRVKEIRSELARQMLALAALTTERCGSLIQAVNPKTGSVNIFYRSRGIESIDPEEVAEWEMQEVEHLYTTPPAQLLRPVELPTGYTSGYSSLGSDERFIRKSELIAALRQQGYEVKND